MLRTSHHFGVVSKLVVYESRNGDRWIPACLFMTLFFLFLYNWKELESKRCLKTVLVVSLVCEPDSDDHCCFGVLQLVPYRSIFLALLIPLILSLVEVVSHVVFGMIIRMMVTMMMVDMDPTEHLTLKIYPFLILKKHI